MEQAVGSCSVEERTNLVHSKPFQVVKVFLPMLVVVALAVVLGGCGGGSTGNSSTGGGASSGGASAMGGGSSGGTSMMGGGDTTASTSGMTGNIGTTAAKMTTRTVRLTQSRNSGISGKAIFTDIKGGVRVVLDMKNLSMHMEKPGTRHLAHIHQPGTCADDSREQRRAGRISH